ncbi:hypothetical protein IDM40_11935 [Nocardiopsis sp. HNM0947]|uniref:Lipoprotein n=1 Tax=Nocardiopsis coralli TaxID=2772213 RepID=A0ABR9P6D8_9ACTN|nr:hypothetical protein [Nocardiopsis coralli]MBE2999408.1 hypothetical protein [Nocardiopsis coralli]
MGVRSTAVTAPLAATLLCGALVSCSNGQDEADEAMAELEKAAGNLSATALRPAAERAFARNGHPLPEGLVCSTQAPGAPSPSDAPEEEEGTEARAEGPGVAAPTFTAAPDLGPTFTAAPDQEADEEAEGYLMVVCTGDTEDGDEASFEAMLPRQALAARDEGDDALPGEFTGRVGEEEVFTMDCLQCAPEAEAQDEGETEDEAQDEEAET